MDYSVEDNGISILGLGEINLENIFDNGQCFRFVPCRNGYTGVAFGKRISFVTKSDCLFMYPCSEHDFLDIWYDFLDLNRDYNNLFVEPDAKLAECIQLLPGLRVLNQDPFETLISFIISANNNIKRIRGIIGRMCEYCGMMKEDTEGIYYGFPDADTLSRLSEKELISVGAGYRAPYIIETANAIKNGFCLEELKKADYFYAKKSLCSLKGVGPKVADCILLFSLGHTRAFPVDVWIKRVLEDMYGFSGNDKQVSEFVYNKFGDNAGIAQQYLYKYSIGG